MKLITIIKRIKEKCKGSLTCAKENGMIVESGVTVMGGVNFGSEPYLIHLKENCRISFDVAFITHDGGTWAFRNTWPEYKPMVKYGKIVVGESSFIGCRSIIMPGVTIGKNCVIGAGGIVTKDVPDETVVCGTPAKAICSTLDYAKKCFDAVPSDFDFEMYARDKKKYLMEYYMNE